MALIGTRMDSRTVAGIAANGSASYAHGLPASPTFVIVNTATSAGSVSAPPLINAGWDATNVTLQNIGNATSGVLTVVAVAAHSIIT